jgi:cysteine desulfuration protein SufE
VSSVQQRVDKIVGEFIDLEPRERLELLLEFAENLPPLPPELQAQKEAGEHRVHECQTPVFLWVLPDGDALRIHGDVAPEAPTVKGFVGILAEAFSGGRPEDVLAVPGNLMQRLGLIEALGMVRMRGLGAIETRIRRETQKLLAGDRH